MKINFDLENSPLQIKTDSVVGSDEKVDVTFYSGSSWDDWAGGVFLSFSSPPQYRLLFCISSITNFSTELPSKTEKVWTITKSIVSGKIRVVTHCNDKEVLNVVLSDTMCSYDGWSDYWSKDVTRIKFSDTASDYYRAGE